MTTPTPQLRIPDDVAALIRQMHPHLKQKIRAALRAIQLDPEAGKALQAGLVGLRSFRVNRFRMIYRQTDEALEIVAVGPRHAIYEETLRLIRQST